MTKAGQLFLREVTSQRWKAQLCLDAHGWVLARVERIPPALAIAAYLKRHPESGPVRVVFESQATRKQRRFARRVREVIGVNTIMNLIERGEIEYPPASWGDEPTSVSRQLQEHFNAVTNAVPKVRTAGGGGQ